MRKLLTFICIVALCFSIVGCGASNDPKDLVRAIYESDKALPEKFVESFNTLSETAITDRASFEPTDKKSEFYKAEYRLDEWKGATGETAKIGEHRIEMVNFGSAGDPALENNKLRIYVTTDTIDAALAIFPSAVWAMDPDAPEEDVQELVDHIKEWGIKNGLFVGKLKGTFFRQKNGAQFMLELS